MPAIFQLRVELERPAGEIALAVELIDTGSPELRRVTALLATGGEPIEWRTDAAGEPVSDAALEVPLEVDGDRRASAVFAGPFEPGVYHLMLANHGARATLHGTTASPSAALLDDGGCGCSSASASRGGPLAVLLLLAMAGRRRPSRGGGRGRRRARATRRSGCAGRRPPDPGGRRRRTWSRSTARRRPGRRRRSR